MSTTLLTIIIGGGFMALAFAMIGIRMLLLKDGEFRGTCSSNNPLLADKTGNCSICGGDMNKCENSSQQA